MTNLKLRSMILAAGAMLALALALPAAAPAQVPSANPPFNVDMGGTPAAATPIITLATAAGPTGNGTTNSATQNNLDKLGVVCTYAQTASSGSASTTFGIAGFDSGTATWNTLLTSSAISGPVSAAPYAVAVHPGIAVSSLPTNYAAQNVILPRYWRVFVTVGSTNSVAATVGCVLTK